jgi:glutathione-regulated potassium-efflux system ancillary protein KefC/glutathione-regulated potassium-efflux system protein KefB
MTLTTITTVLAVAIVAVILTRKARLSAILGYLAAGVLLGPWGFGVVRDATEILHIAEFGVVLLLFVIGLELKPQRLWVMRRTVFGLGALQLVLCIGLLALALTLVGVPVVAALVGAFGLTFASTALVVQVLSERGQLNSTAGRSAFGVALFQDLAAMPGLAVLPLLGGVEVAASGNPWLAALKVVALFGAAVVAGRYLLRPILRAVALTKVREAFTATALLIVLGMAAVAGAVGLSMALGAFIAGVLLADSEYRHELEADIDPFRGLLLGLFFVGVGMAANLGLVRDAPLLILAGVVAMCVSKWLASVAAARVLKLKGSDARRFAWAMAPGGEFAFVIFLAASGEGILPATLRDQLIVIVTLSMLIGPVLIMFGDWLEERLARGDATREFDIIEDNEPSIIVAGFGRFGQIIGRVLTTQRIRFTALEASPTQVDFVRRFGNKIYYGDASRIDVLRAAGSERAKLLVLAIDDVEASVRAAELARRHFPQLRILARVRNRQHAYKMMDLGVDYVVRDTLHSSLDMSRRVLEFTGLAAAEAARRVDVFRAFDQRTLEAQHAFHEDEPRILQSALEASRELEQLFADDLAGAEPVDRQASAGSRLEHADERRDRDA